MIHYHGTPMGGDRKSARRTAKRRAENAAAWAAMIAAGTNTRRAARKARVGRLVNTEGHPAQDCGNPGCGRCGR